MSYRYRWMRHGWLRKPLVLLSFPLYAVMYLPEWWSEVRGAMSTDWNGE
jgi:hypothetical protein